MRKLTLDLDTLDVQSFNPTPRAAEPRGTVQGHASFSDCTCENLGTCRFDCPSWYNEATTCQVSDLGTCAATACGSCGASCHGGATCVTCQGVQCEETS
jgi:hypothetical protein